MFVADPSHTLPIAATGHLNAIGLHDGFANERSDRVRALQLDFTPNEFAS